MTAPETRPPSDEELERFRLLHSPMPDVRDPKYDAAWQAKTSPMAERDDVAMRLLADYQRLRSRTGAAAEVTEADRAAAVELWAKRQRIDMTRTSVPLQAAVLLWSQTGWVDDHVHHTDLEQFAQAFAAHRHRAAHAKAGSTCIDCGAPTRPMRRCLECR